MNKKTSRYYYQNGDKCGLCYYSLFFLNYSFFYLCIGVYCPEICYILSSFINPRSFPLASFYKRNHTCQAHKGSEDYKTKMQ